MDGVTFEIDLGYTLVVPSGAAISDGDTFNVAFGALVDRVFEFDSSGSRLGPEPRAGDLLPGHDARRTDRRDWSRRSAANSPVPQPSAWRFPGTGSTCPMRIWYRWVLAAAWQWSGSPGTDRCCPVELDSSMLATEVAAVVQQALADRFAGGVTEAFKTYDNVVRVIGQTCD